MTFDYRKSLAAHTPTDIPDEHAYAKLWLQQVTGLDSLPAQAERRFIGGPDGVGICGRISVRLAAYFY